MREKIVKKFKEFGFTYVYMDLEGYRTGSMNSANTNVNVFILVGLLRKSSTYDNSTPAVFFVVRLDKAISYVRIQWYLTGSNCEHLPYNYSQDSWSVESAEFL